uniref:Uncharacterized protein n=1 Tax=Anguilla anguilla TaxID=7936 RepID=A0A0E9PQV7_ANGAN
MIVALNLRSYLMGKKKLLRTVMLSCMYKTCTSMQTDTFSVFS